MSIFDVSRTRCVRTPAIPHNTGERLAAEWARLRHRPSAVAHAQRWALVDGAVTDLDDVLAAIGFETAPTPAAERALRRLVLIAADDDLAARIVVQRIVPGLLGVVRRRRRTVGHDAFDELLGAAWVAIRTFNPDRRPACLAAALIADADDRAFRRATRRRSHDELPTGELGDVADVRPRHAIDELDQLFVEALDAGVDEADIRMLRQLLAAPTAVELAAMLQVTPRTIRNRRDRITDRLREVALAA